VTGNSSKKKRKEILCLIEKNKDEKGKDKHYRSIGDFYGNTWIIESTVPLRVLSGEWGGLSLLASKRADKGE
jgi:hypothetical protein